MYLHLGQEMVVRTDSIVGIFDIENTSLSRSTRSYLAQAEKRKLVVNVTYDLPKSFVVCQEQGEQRVYIAQVAPSTLKKRVKYMGE